MSRIHYDIASALVIADGHVLLVRQSIAGHSFWSLPGGGRENGESMFDAALRELREETGLDLPATAALSQHQPAFSCAYTNDGDHSSCHVETFVFQTAHIPPAPQDPDASIEEARWFPVALAVTQLAALPWPMMGEPAIAWLSNAASQDTLHWRYAIDAQGRSTLLHPPAGSEKQREHPIAGA